jgi:hypothetical protein
MTIFLVWAWLAFLVVSFAVTKAGVNGTSTDAQRSRVVLALAWIGSNITAILIFLASR